MESRITPATLIVTSLADGVINPSDDATVFTLREAVQRANASAADDVITFAPELTEIGPATIVLTRGQLAITDTSGVTTIEGPGPAWLHLDANDSSRIFHVATDAEAIISGLDLQNGFADAFDEAGLGGAVLNDGDVTLAQVEIHDSAAAFAGGGVASFGELTIIESTLRHNNADTGGGIYVGSGTAELLDSFVTDNTATSYGGGIETLADLTVSGSVISLNSAQASGGIDIVVGLVNVTESLITANMAQLDGGGLGVGASAILVIEASTISANSAGQSGGGISGPAEVRDSLLTGNYAGKGGGAYALSTLSITNSTLAGNFAFTEGGAIFNNGNSLLVNCTIVDNRADVDGGTVNTGGGIFNAGSHQATLRNTIVAGNVRGPSEIPSDLDGTGGAVGQNNLIGDPASAGGIVHGQNGNILGAADASGRVLLALTDILNPVLADNGGPTLTLALVATSPAVDAGSNAAVLPSVLWDQRGEPFARIVDGADADLIATVDIGAFELAKAPSILDLEVTPPTPVFGEDVTFTASITSPISGIATGSITFNIDGVDGETVTVSLIGGATLTVNTLAVGEHSIQARYSGDSNYLPSTSVAVTVTVGSAQSMALSGGEKLAENQLGAIVGDLSVQNSPPGKTYTFSVTDVRFEVVGSRLQLRTDAAVQATGATIGLDVTATDQDNTSFSQHFELTVEANTYPWHKTGLAEDANSDNVRDIRDATFIIRQIRRNLGGPLPIPRPTASNGGHYGDVLADNILNIQDAIAVIRFLRRHPGSGEGETIESGIASQPFADTASAWDAALMMFVESAPKKKVPGLSDA